MQANSQFINRAINEILERGSRGALATVIDSPTHPDSVGAKIIIEESGERSGSFGDSKLGNMVPTSAQCYSCHADHAAVDTTFVQFYPTLLPIAKAKGTLSAGYVKESGDGKK